jgi:hypothetical protein
VTRRNPFRILIELWVGDGERCQNGSPVRLPSGDEARFNPIALGFWLVETLHARLYAEVPAWRNCATKFPFYCTFTFAVER